MSLARPALVGALVILTATPAALAQRANRPAVRTRQGTGSARPRQHDTERAERAIVRRYQTERRVSQRRLAQVFRRVAVDRDYRGEYVLMRDQHVTAFLDITDPQHPAFDPTRETDEDSLARIPLSRRAHILVVPNHPREHLGRSLDGPITTRDVEETLQVMKSAEALAKRLGIQNPQVFVNPESRLAVGYLHVHIVGERPPSHPYPAPLR